MKANMTISILGFKHTVHVDNNKLQEYLEDNEYYTVDEVRGLYDDDLCAIFVHDDLTPLDTACTVLHEWIHAVGTIMGHPSLCGQSEKNEKFVDQLSRAIVDLLRQKEFVKFLQDLIDKHDGESKK